MSKRTLLGKVTPESYSDFLGALEAATKELEEIARREYTLKPEDEPQWRAYKLMNGLGAAYGGALVRAYTSGITASPDLPQRLGEVKDELWAIYNDLEARRSLRDETVIRQAAQEMPEHVPAWIDLDATIAAAHASYSGKGVYFNDFYYSVMMGPGDIARAIALFLAKDRRAERYAFSRSGAGGGYVPVGLTGLTEEEERELLRRVVKEANRQIAQRSYYGLRPQALPSSGDFTIIRWSNGPARWFLDSLTKSAELVRDRGTMSIPLDANVVLVPFHETLVEKVLDVLDDHPLYDFSLEAGRGDNVQATDQAVRRVIRSMLDQTHPEEDAEERALYTMDWFEIFKKAKAGDQEAKDQVDSFPMNPTFGRLVRRWMKSR